MTPLYHDMPAFELAIFHAINKQFGHVAWRGSLDKFANIVGQRAGDIAPVLRDKSFIDFLAAVGTQLWFEGNDVVVVDTVHMKLRQPCGPYACRLCLGDANGDMSPDPDPRSKNGKVHTQCMPRFKRLLQIQQMNEERANAWLRS